ncbi:autotransporter-associated beta strand repeat-containing protein [Prosthecobacter sp. SYSU 5D2]|uniref:autotransporter-associated beta strand repeat-containing protein n=1 Tax=Prosthecobacter sp. SYSU 5D2 TaxID=3134134 RepID=UPI0031FE8D7E
MKKFPPPQSLSQQMMHTLRYRLRLPVTLVMIFCNLAWSLQGFGQTIPATADGRTRVIRLDTPNGAATLRPGMSVSGAQVSDGTYITQVLSGDQILVNTPLTGSFTGSLLTFGAVDEVEDTEEARTDYTKNTQGLSLVFGENSLRGNILVSQGILQAGGVTSNGRTWMQDLIDDNSAVRMANNQTTILNFASNESYYPLVTTAFNPYKLFERIGSLGTTNPVGSSATLATVNLTGGTTSTALAVGGDNSDTLFRGNIRGDSNAWLIKEGTGTMTWQSENADSLRGTIRVESGTLAVTGAEGLNPAVSLMVSNKAGAVLDINVTAPQSVSSLTGGGRGAVTSFANGVLGALGGNYISGTGGEVRVATGRNFTISSLGINTVMSYGGTIAGGGSLIKEGRNVLELLGDNTYGGFTAINASPTDNTVSMIRLGAYGTSSGVGSLESGGHGHLPSTTSLRLQAGGSGIGRAAIFDLNGATQTVSSLQSSNLVGDRTVIMGTGTLTINTVGSDLSGDFAGNFLGRGTINVTATRNTGGSTAGWTLSGTSNDTHRGAFNLLGGTVSLTRGAGTLGDQVHVTVMGDGELRVVQSDIVGSLSGNGRVIITSGQALTLSSGPAGGAFANAWSGVISGSGGGLTLGQGGSIRLTTAQNYTGATRVNSGSALYLDYGSGDTPISLVPGSLALNGGSLFLSGKVGQTVANVTVGVGSTTLAAPLDSPDVKLHFTNITRDGAGGGVLQVRGNTLSTGTAALASGIMGGYMTHHTVDSLTDKPLVSWATRDPVTGQITSLANYSSAFGSGVHTDVTTLNAGTEGSSLPVSGSLGSLRFNQAAAVNLTLDARTTIQSGGILLTPSVGPSDNRITSIDGAGITGGQGGPDYNVGNELIIHQHNARGKLTIDAPIVDNTGATRLTKAGQGTLVLTYGNTYSGQTSILGGVLELADSVVSPGTMGNLGNSPGAVINHGYLVFNRSAGSLALTNSITGSGSIRQMNTGEVILSGSDSTYTGATQVTRGRLGVGSQSALGSTAGQTSVSALGTLELRGIITPEAVQLKGGKLSSVNGTSELRGALTLTQSSTLAAPDSDQAAPLIITGRISNLPGSTLNLTTEGVVGSAGRGGKFILTNTGNQIDAITVGAKTSLQIGLQDSAAPATFSGGSVGRSTITTVDNQSNVIVNTNNSHLVFGSKITGAGNLYVTRGASIVYLTADNDYTGRTVVGGALNPGLNLPELGGQLRIGNDTYTGSIGTGELVIQAGGAVSSVRHQTLKSGVMANNITLNTFSTSEVAGLAASFVRGGIGSVNLTGVITVGTTTTGPERALLQTDAGGKLTISNRIQNGEFNRLNITNGGFLVFNNRVASNVQDLWGVVAGGGSTTFSSDGIINLKAVNTFSGATYFKRGLVVGDNFEFQPPDEEDPESVGVFIGQAFQNDADLHVGRGARIQFKFNETVGMILTQRGGSILVNSGANLIMDDNGVYANYGDFLGDGTLTIAPTGTAWVGMFGNNEMANNMVIGSAALTTVRINNLQNAGVTSSLGRGDAINLGTAGGETRLEYIGIGGPSQATDRQINLLGTAATIRIAGNGRSGMILNGGITSNVNRNLFLHGQTVGNTINGAITEGAGRLNLSVNTAAGANDMYGPGSWTFTNPNSDFSGNITIQLGTLELKGSLGDGTGTTSVMGDLTSVRTIIMGLNSYDARRYDLYTGLDTYIPIANVPLHTGTILFNDPEEGTAVLGRNITFNQPFNSTTNPGSAEFINNGNKVIVIEGDLTTAANGNRNWILDGTNTGANTISGIIRDPTSGSNAGILKEGTGRWRLVGDSAGSGNEYVGVTQVARGTLELAGGFAVFDNGVINLTNAGSDGSAVGAATLRILNSETIGGLTGAYGTTVELVDGATLSVQAGTQFYNGLITGLGNIVRTGSAGDMVLTNLNTYTGSTTVTTTGTGTTRIMVRTLANGGAASGIGMSSSAASNLILNSDNIAGGLRWQGTSTQSTDRLFTLGAGSNALWADGQVFGDFAPSINWTNTGAIEFLAPNTDHTLVLRGVNISNNTFAPQINDNGSGTTSLSKLDAGEWELKSANGYSGGTTVGNGILAISHSNALGTGNVTLAVATAATSASGGLLLKGSLNVPNNIINSNANGMLGVTGGDSVLSGNVSVSGTNPSFRVGIFDDSTLTINNPITGALGSSGRFVKYGQGTLIMNGTNTYTGITGVAGGGLVLNYDTATGGTNGSKLANSQALELGFSAVSAIGNALSLNPDRKVGGLAAIEAYSGGTIILRGGSHTEVVSASTLNAGAHRIIREGGTSVLQMGTLTRTVSNAVNSYGTIDFNESGIARTNTLSTTTAGGMGGILAGTSTGTLNSAYATVGQTTWATTAASGSNLFINGYAEGNYVTAFSATTTAGNVNISGSTSAAAGSYANTLRFNTNNGGTTTLTLNGTLNLMTGGILVTKNMTDNVIITGAAGSLQRGQNTINLDTVIHHYGSGLLILDVPLVNFTNAQALTKTGGGTLVLNKTNTFTGRVTLNEGTIQVGDGTLATANATLGAQATANNISMSAGTTLRFNVANPDMENVLGQMNGGGLLHLAATNQSMVTLASTNTNFVGDILVEGGILRMRSNSNGLANLRNNAVIGDGGTLNLHMVGTAALSSTKRLTLQDGAKVTVTTDTVTTTTPRTITTLSGVITIENTDANKKVSFDVGADRILTVSGVIRSANGFTKLGDGVMNVTANQFEEAVEGAVTATSGVVTPNSNPTLRGQVVVAEGELRLIANTIGRSLGATGVGNETIVQDGATLNLFGQSLNYGNDEDPFREIVRISGSGTDGAGALRTSNGQGGVSTIIMDGNATISGGGFFNTTSRLTVAGYDINRNTSTVAASDLLAGNYEQVDAVIHGNNRTLTIVGNSTFNDATGANVTFRDPTFASALNSIVIAEGTFRIEQEAGNTRAFQGLTAQNVTNGIRIAYAGPTLADQSNATLGLGPNVGSRLNFHRTFGTTHSVNITMDGVTAAANGGANYIELGTDASIPNPRTYLSGLITLTGAADRNIFNIDAATLRQTVTEQGNLTGHIQSKLVVNGQITGVGGFTKTGLNELRLTADNTFTGAMNILRSGAVSVPWQDNTVVIGTNSYNTLGDAEGWAEWGVTLSGLNGRVSGTTAINLQRRGMLVLDNTNRLDLTSQVTGGNNNNRVNNAASINFDHGWLRIIGGTETNTESLATEAGARINVLSGTNTIELMPTSGTSTSMILSIGEISRSAGAVLQFNNLDSTSKFGSLLSADAGLDSVQVLLENIGTLQQSGLGAGLTDKKVVIGLLGGIMPHEYLSDIREHGYNNANISDYLAQGRIQQAIAASHFMTYDPATKVLRPLDDSEYFVPANGLLDNLPSGASGQNVNLLEMVSIARQNMTINSLRFGPLSDSLGNNVGENVPYHSATTLTSLVDAHQLQLLVDGTLTISSGMISSAYFTTGNNAVTPNNTGAFDTLIAGGTLNFGSREAIINNQNAVIRANDGTVQLGNLEIRSIISGSGGLLKTGQSPVFLDGRNTYSGVTTVSNGTLFLRNGRHALGAGGEGNGVVIEGNGSLSSGSGIQVGSAAAYENVLIKALAADQYVMRADSDLTNWFSHVTVDNVDKAGHVLFSPIVRLDNDASAVFNGNFYGGSSAVSQDILATDSRTITFETPTPTSSTQFFNNTFIFRGQFGDKSDAEGNAVPIADSISTLQTLAGTRTNENEVLQVRLAGGSSETNFIMEQQYNAVGRLTLFQGNLLITYDPDDTSPEGTGFWTNSAISKIGGGVSSTAANAESFGLSGGSTMQGFIMDSNTYGAATGTGAAAAAGVSSLFLTKAGQHFNMATWSAIGGGAKWIGGLNETGTVYFGNSADTGTLTIVNAGVRLHAAAGGTVEFDQRMVTSGTVGATTNNPQITKSGRGTVIVKNSTNTAVSAVNLEIAGGKLVLDHAGANVALVRSTGANNAFMGGGVLHAVGNPGANSVVALASTSTTNSVLNLRVGSGTEIIAEGRGGFTMTVNAGNTNNNVSGGVNRSNITRLSGSSLNFVEATGGIINLNFNEFTPSATRDTIIPWATYSNTPRQALDFAMSPTGTGRVTAVTRQAADEENDLASWTERRNITELGSGFTGTLVDSLILNTLRFDTAAASAVTLGTNSVLSLEGNGIAGGILVSSNTGSANKSITGGYLTAFNSGAFGGSIVAGSNIISNVPLVAFGNLSVNDPIAGVGIPDGTSITDLNPGARTITISLNAIETLEYTNLSNFITSFIELDFAGRLVNGSRLVTNVTNVGALETGMRITGNGIPVGTTISEINENEVTLSVPATISSPGNGTSPLKYVVGGTQAGSTVIRGVPSGFDLAVDMPISGAGIPVGAYIESFSEANNTITMTIAANATVPVTRLSTSTPEIMIHHYGQGTLTVGSTVTGNGSLTIAGPMTTLPEQFGTTGVVKLTGNNSYTGSTVVTGSVLEISNVNALGINPTSAANGHIILNGGTLRWTGDVANLGNRGITFHGSGGVIDIVKPTANLMIGDGISGAQASIASQALFQGDLVKMGAGSLTLTGNNATFQGMLDVREGTLIVMADNGTSNAGDITPLGTTRSKADSTILRSGTNLQMFLGNGANGGDWTLDEFITFEGNNVFTYGGLQDVAENIALDLPVYNLGSRRPLNLNGILEILGTTTFDVTANGILRFGNNSGYITGSGNIIKDGQGQLQFRSNIPDWTGGLEIKQGTVIVGNQADALGTGYVSGKTIILGSTERQDAAELLVQLADTSIQGWLFEVNNDIEVVYNPTQTKRLGIDATSNSTQVNYNGDITLNDNLILLMRDVSNAIGGEQAYVNFNGSFRDGAVTSGNLLVQTDDVTPNNLTQGRNYGYAVLNADNSGWTGDITISNNLAYNQDTTAILRVGHSRALTAANDVKMNYNSILQAGGRNVTIGNLSTLGGEGGFYGDAGTMSSNNGSTEIIENAASTPSTLTITQTTPVTYEAVWDAHFRNGTLNSQFFAPGANVQQPSAALSITKAGNGWATLTLDNDYTGATVVQAGVLQVGRNGLGDTGALPSAANAATLMTRVMAGATIAGTGTVQGRLTILSGGTLQAGDSAGADLGTLVVNGNVIFSTGSNALMQVRTASYNNPGSLTASDDQYVFWRNGVLTDAFSGGLSDLVTTSQHDMVMATGTINWAPGSKITLASDGYTPKAGDIIRMFNATSFVGDINVGPELRSGGENLPGLDLILFALGGNLLWDVSYFNSHGILMVVEADVAVSSIPAPVITQMPQSNQSQTEPLEPGTMVTLTAQATTTGDPAKLRYQWILNGIPVFGATNRIYTFPVNFNTKGVYTIAATNEGGTTLSPDEFAVQVLVNDVPDILFDTTQVNKAPGSSHTFDIAVGGQEPFEYQWLKNGQPLDGETNKQLVLENISEDDEALYSVEVTNPVDTVTSGAALLNVLDPISSVVVTKTPQNVYLKQTVTFSSTVVGDGPFTYQWKRGTANINGATGPTFVISNVTAAAAGNYSVVVTSEVNSVVSNLVPLVLNEPFPAIQTAPVPRTVLTGSPFEIRVQASGLPVLTYTWRKDNRVLPFAGTPVISIESATLADGGTYVVEVSNSEGKISTAKEPFIPAEIVVVDSGSQILPVAPLGTAKFTARVAMGRKTQGVTYQWNKVLTREVVIPGEGDGEDDGEGDGEGDDNGDTIVIEEYLVPIVPGEDPRISGANTSEMEIEDVQQGLYTAVPPGDEGLYRCVVTGLDGVSVTGSEYDLRVFTAAPEFTAELAFPNGLIGRDYSFQVPVERDDRSKTPEKITASGLPPGLSIDPFSGLISGRPSATKAGGYRVRITLANKLGKVTREGILTVDDLLPTVTGAWVGLVDRDPVLGDNLGGRLDLTVTTKATFSGKLMFAGATYGIKGLLNMTDTEPAAATGKVFIKRKGKPLPPPLELEFTLDPVNNTIASGTITDGTSTVDISEGWRMTYSKLEPASTYTGYYTMALGLADDSPLIPDAPPLSNDGSAIAPLGAGYATFTVAADGKLKIAGKMADGEKLTSSTFIGPDGEIALYQHLYKRIKSIGRYVDAEGNLIIDPKMKATGGSVHGKLVIDDKDDADAQNSNNTVGGDVTWVRPPSPSVKDRAFKTGFGFSFSPLQEPLDIVAVGGRYDPPADGMILGLTEAAVTDSPNARIEFFYGGDLDFFYRVEILDAEFTSQDPSVNVVVTKNSKIVVPKDTQSPDAKTTVKAVAKTGRINGSFVVTDFNPRYPLRPYYVKRSVKFEGVIINEPVSGGGTQQVGVGFFLLPQLPNADLNPSSTDKTSPIYSGRFTLEPLSAPALP